MASTHEDVAGTEVAADLLVQGLNRADISSISDLVTPATVILRPSRRTAKGSAALEMLRNIAMRHERIRLMSTDTDILADGFVREIGQLSMHNKQRNERSTFRYQILWQKIANVWTIASLTWTREALPQQQQPAKSGDAGDEGIGGM